jgi:hypothetical protein
MDVAARPALLTGLLWSAGNVCSIFATEYLGMALGWPLVQCQLVVSNLWCVAACEPNRLLQCGRWPRTRVLRWYAWF